jgi:hypothetical protein
LLGRALRIGQASRVDVPLGVVEVVTGLRVDAADRAHHLGAEQDVTGVDDLQQQVDAGLVVDARVEEHVLHDVLGQRRLVQHVGQTPVAAPVVGNGAAAMRDHQTQVSEIGEQVSLNELHERCSVRVDVVRAGGVEVGVAAAGDVHHGGHVQLDHLLEERVPVPVGERRAGPHAAARVGVEVAADEPEFQDAALQFGHRLLEVGAR